MKQTITLKKRDIDKIINLLVVFHSEFDETEFHQKTQQLLEMILKMKPHKK